MNSGIFLLLGTNLGDKRANLAIAREHLQQQAGTIAATSAIFRTAAWGKTDQPEFYNQAIELNTTLGPRTLLSTVLAIEQQMGRVRVEKWGERIIDLDIIFYNHVVVNEPDLIIPHPGIPVRRFVLAPLAEIAPTFRHPLLDRTIRELLASCDDAITVEKLL
jgi:2-amino-4-hydroxy-6-hydroxymethyldihydropteridine diphosphokinase